MTGHGKIDLNFGDTVFHYICEKCGEVMHTQIPLEAHSAWACDKCYHANINDDK